MGRISMPQGKGSQMHNRRDYQCYGKSLPDNIDGGRSWQNIVLVDRDLREAYEDFFGEAVAEYNTRQKRTDRKIDNYLDRIGQSRNGEKPFYENVVQWGSRDDFYANPVARDMARQALLLYANGFEARNPNLKLVGAYIHMDEASPHLHLDYVPVAHGYKRGLSTRNSLDRAMKEMGFCPVGEEGRKNNATKVWKEHERAVFGQICRSVGLEVEQERPSQRRSLSVEEYKDARDSMLGSIEFERDQVAAQKAALEIEANRMKAEVEEAQARKEAAIAEAAAAVAQARAAWEEVDGLEARKGKLQKAIRDLSGNSYTAVGKDGVEHKYWGLGGLKREYEKACADLDDAQAKTAAARAEYDGLLAAFETLAADIRDFVRKWLTEPFEAFKAWAASYGKESAVEEVEEHGRSLAARAAGARAAAEAWNQSRESGQEYRDYDR